MNRFYLLVVSCLLIGVMSSKAQTIIPDQNEKGQWGYVDAGGKIVYKRVGIIKPIADKIWDNRFMAMEEGAYGADLKATKFVKVSGGDFYPGMLIREMK